MSLHVAIILTFVFSSGVVFVALMLSTVGNTLFHVAFAVAQFDHAPSASFALYEYVLLVASSCAVAVYVAFVAFVI